MIPEIGLMVGFYIITRTISFLTRKDLRAEPFVVKVFSAVTILITIIIMLSLFVRGAKSPF